MLTLALGPWLIDLMTASPDVQLAARDYLIYAALASVIGVFAFAYDGIYVGATWTRDMRNLMIVSLALYLAAWWLLRPYGNAGLWIAILIYFGARGACRRRAIRRWRGRRSNRPRLRGDRRGIAPDRIGKLIQPPDAHEIDQLPLDRRDQADPAEDKPRVKLDQARARP